MTSPRIRVALIGLSKSAATSWAAAAHLPYLLSPRGKAKYEIVALLNSSVEKAKAAISAFGLSPETRAYGDPKDLAADPDVDLVVVNTRVDSHYATARPSLEAAKAVFSEWPLAQDTEHARDLVDVARRTGARTLIGTQGRLAPVSVKIKELLEQGRIGRVLGTEVTASGGVNDRSFLPDFLAYFVDRKIGGNILTIGFGHVYDTLQDAIGELTEVQSTVQLRRPAVEIRDPGTGKTINTVTSDVPDYIVVTGVLEESKVTRAGATALLRFRRGQPFPGDAPLVWTIHGEKGEIRVISPGSTAIQANAFDAPVPIEVHDFETEKVDKVEWAWADWQAELPVAARNVASLYEAYAEGKAYPTFEDALRRHEQLDEILSGWRPTSS